MKTTKIAIPTSARATNENNINDLSNDVNASTDNMKTEGNVDFAENIDEQTSVKVYFPNTKYFQNLILNFPKEPKETAIVLFNISGLMNGF